MIGWLKNLNDASRLISINEASRISGISAKAIEKDWWVTLSLKLVFNTPYAKHFAFKGGTSLSKGWQLIDRFSEDIDISLSSEAVGIAYTEKPSKTFVEQLRRAGCNELRFFEPNYQNLTMKQCKSSAFIIEQILCNSCTNTGRTYCYLF